MLALNKGFRLARLFGAKFVLDPYPSFEYVLVLVAHVVLVSPPPVQALFFWIREKVENAFALLYLMTPIDSRLFSWPVGSLLALQRLPPHQS